ncbi:aromatic acid exporter family protein [Paenibacillus sp. P26]|nr:aromatic acid exporter family protein [Paenibacillus sp. P26]UUZ93992.1 aromatic acid exporter family protein [Paenibacillus sp. P25]
MPESNQRIKISRSAWKAIHRTSQIWKTGLAAAIAWDVGQLFVSKHPFFAPLAAILCMQITVEDSIKKGYQRIAGIVGGIIIADIITRLFIISDWSIALLVCLGLGISALFKWNGAIASQFGVTVLLVVTVGAGSSSYGIDRIVETLVGALISILINMLIFPPDFTDEASTRIKQTTNQMAEHVQAIELWLQQGASRERGGGLLETSNNLNKHVESAVAALNQAIQATKFSPLVKRRNEQLQRQKEHLQTLQEACRHLTGMQALILEWIQNTNMTRADLTKWSDRFKQLAAMVKNRHEGKPYPLQQSISSAQAYDLSLEIEAYHLAKILSRA